MDPANYPTQIVASTPSHNVYEIIWKPMFVVYSERYNHVR